jgi:hypothetical protein
VAHEFFGNDFRQALSALRELERLGHARRVLSFGLYRWIPNDVPRPPKRTPRRRKRGKKRTTTKSPTAPPALTEVEERVLRFVTDEFNEGAAGNRVRLPTAYEVAKACLNGDDEAELCKAASRHLHRLMTLGKVIQVKDEDVSAWSWHNTFWALPHSSFMVKDSTPKVGAPTLNRYGFTDDEWTALKPWQRNLIRNIERAETASTSWA